MSLLFCDGFDHYDNAYLGQKWDIVEYAQISNNGRESQGVDWDRSYISSLTKTTISSATLIAGVARFENDVQGGDLIYFMNSSTEQAALRVNGNGAVEIHTFPGGVDTLAGTSASGVIIGGAYIYVEFAVSFSTTSGTARAMVDGQLVLSLSGIVTSQAGTGANSVTIAATAGSRSIDDVYICNAVGSTNNNFLGDVRVALLVPDANGRVNQWTRTGGTSAGNYTAVSEVPPASPAPDDDTSYVASSTATQIDAYKVSSLGPVTTVKAVQIVAAVRKDDSGSRVLALGFGNGTVESYDAGTSVPSTYAMLRRTLDTNPLTSANWAPADLTSAQIALKVIS